ncbi:MAG: hypothetical protein MT490_11955 [Sphingomonas sp.]|uniref:hypothetical protein n=1 Tax=Sphingomonas sp. TaxID=28214 RepID=UPI00227464F3|nr:hypothetical protein [Sphingomonas sp.]MCX8476501.1 hypothetical protein [Sphingomonas sp.]
MAEGKTGGGARWLFWLFAAIGLCAALAVIYIALRVATIGSGRVIEPAPIEARNPEQRFTVADTDAIPGTDLVQIVIATEASVSGGHDSYSRGDRPDERNLILLDQASGASRKLLPDNSRRIVARYMLPAVAGASKGDSEWFTMTGSDGKDVTPPVAYYLLRVRAAQGQSEDLLLGNIASGRQDFVLKGIDGVDRIWMQTPTRIAMLLRQQRKLHYRAFEVPELKLAVARPVEID